MDIHSYVVLLHRCTFLAMTEMQAIPADDGAMLLNVEGTIREIRAGSVLEFT